MSYENVNYHSKEITDALTFFNNCYFNTKMHPEEPNKIKCGLYCEDCKGFCQVLENMGNDCCLDTIEQSAYVYTCGLDLNGDWTIENIQYLIATLDDEDYYETYMSIEAEECIKHYLEEAKWKENGKDVNPDRNTRYGKFMKMKDEDKVIIVSDGMEIETTLINMHYMFDALNRVLEDGDPCICPECRAKVPEFGVAE